MKAACEFPSRIIERQLRSLFRLNQGEFSPNKLDGARQME